ncbi:hypothetical protein [Peribacillus muralis]|uniref:hypothetical protein n=1 Tax=Peribacillus muralis TaxID=264697 RepID=UPI003D08008E
MHRNRELYSFLSDKATQLTEDWYATLNKNDQVGVYSSPDPRVIEKLKLQNHQFHLQFFKIFTLEECQFFGLLEDWFDDIGSDEEHFNTSISYCGNFSGRKISTSIILSNLSPCMKESTRKRK